MEAKGEVNKNRALIHRNERENRYFSFGLRGHCAGKCATYGGPRSEVSVIPEISICHNPTVKLMQFRHALNPTGRSVSTGKSIPN